MDEKPIYFSKKIDLIKMVSKACKPKTIRDIITFEKGKPPAQQPYFGTDAELYLTPEYLRGRSSAEPVKPSSKAVRVADGDTIILWDGSNAGEFFRGRRGILSSTMSRIKLNDCFNKEYFFYALKRWESFLKGQTSGSGIPHVDKEIFNKIEVIPFPKPEQTKIAEILSTVDRAIEQTQALIAKQQRIKSGLMQDLLTRGIDEHGNLRSEQTHPFKDSPLGRIPVDWESNRIGDIFEIQLGKMLSQKATEGYSPFFYLGNKNVQWDHVDASVLPQMDFNDRERCKYELKFDDILVCEGGEVGRTAIWRGDVENCYYQKAIHRLRPIDQRFLPSLFPRFMKWCILRGYLSDYTSQTSIAHLTQEKLSAVPIMVPTMPEQIRINTVLDQIDSELGTLSCDLSKFSFIKTALMQDLLTGEKRVIPLLETQEETA